MGLKAKNHFKGRNSFLSANMPSYSILGFVALFGFVLNSASAATCEVPGGTSDDGPAIKAALATCNNGGTVLLDKTYTIASVLETTGLNNVAIELTGTITLSPGRSPPIDLECQLTLHRNLILEV